MWLWLWAVVAFGGVVQAAPPQVQPQETPARLRGLLAALDDPDDAVVADALWVLSKKTTQNDPETRKWLKSFIRELRLVKLLRDSNPDVRGAVVQTLRVINKDAKELVPHVAELLDSPDPDVRGSAAQALGAMGEVATEQAPHLGELLKDSNRHVRRAAAQALGAMGEAAKEQVPRLGELLKDSDSDTRRAAAQALGAMGKVAKEQAPRLGELLKDKDSDVREAAAQALGAMGEAAKEQAARLGESLGDSDREVREAAAQALGAIGEAAKEQAPRLGKLLDDYELSVISAAAQALGAMGKAAKEQAPRLVNLIEQSSLQQDRAAEALAAMGEAAKEQAPRLVKMLKSPNPWTRAAAGKALGAMGEVARQQAAIFGRLLKSSDPVVRSEAVLALGAMGKAAKEQIPRVSELLNSPDPWFRKVAALVLGGMGEVAKDQAPRLGELLKDSDPDVREAAAQALGDMGEAAKEQLPRLGELLKDPDQYVRKAATRALGGKHEGAKQEAARLGEHLKDPNPTLRRLTAEVLGEMGEDAKEQAPRLVELLKDADSDVRREAAEALGAVGGPSIEDAPLVINLLLEDKDELVRRKAKAILSTMGPLTLPHVAAILAMVDRDPGSRSDWLLCAHIAGGGALQVERILRWVAGRLPPEFPTQLTIDEARETLRAFAEFWPHTEKYPVLRDDLAQQIARVANLASNQWTSADFDMLKLHENNLKAAYPTYVENLRAARASVERWSAVRTCMWTWAGHIAFWVLLLFFYPRSPQVQAFFFWNPWVRTITGFGYVGLLLTWVPLLRRRLLAPFAHQLLADADLERFSEESYFTDSEVVIPPSSKRERLLVAFPQLRGQVVLEGASGLGKSLFIKYLLRRSKQLAVFLPAERCRDGVLEAIQAKLEGQAKDTDFLQSIIYSGALDIYIDGLNEVTADTRARIVQFVERNFHGNILLATQRMEWTPPATARRYVLQPLSDEQVSRFLASREPQLGEKAPLRGPEYLKACEGFVQRALSPDQHEELRVAMRDVLSNPMDLTVIAQMLVEGHSPDLFHLRQQQYELMARDYFEVNLSEFPLKDFAEESYTMRLEDRPSLPEERFGKELLRLESFKMVVRRQWKGPDGKEHREWCFRHDKLQEFFIAQTFLGAGNPHIVEHMGDPRFRGVYFLLALLLEPEHAVKLRDQLVLRAANTRDHTVSDEFVTLLEARRGAEQAQLALPPAPVATGT